MTIKALLGSNQGSRWLLTCTALAGILVTLSAPIENSENHSVVNWNPYGNEDTIFTNREMFEDSAGSSPIVTYKGNEDFYPSHFNNNIKRSIQSSAAHAKADKIRNNSFIRKKREIQIGPTQTKRFDDMTSNGFHGDMFADGFGSNFNTMKKRRFNGMDASGFHGNVFSDGFGDFYTMKKRRPEMNAMGFHGDLFSNGFGEFYPMKRKEQPLSTFRSKRDSTVFKRIPDMTSSGFHGDLFSNGFGDFYTMKRSDLPQQKRMPEMTSSGFHGDLFSNGFGDFYTMKRTDKRRPEMTSSGFHGDMFSNGFGNFYTMKRNPYQKRIPEMTSSGFHGDLFSNGFGDFYTMKKRLLNRARLREALNDDSMMPQQVEKLPIDESKNLHKESIR